MKLVLAFLVVLLFSANSEMTFDSSVNYVSNPDFSIPKLGSGQHNVFKSVGAWSEVNNQIQIGDVKVYNTHWTTGQLVDLDANKNSNIYQTINLDAGYYQLNITWAANQLTKNLDSSKFSVYWNDVLVQFFTPVDYNIHKQTLVVKAIQGANKLSLRGEGTEASGPVGAGINFVGLYAQKKNIIFDSSVNYVSNPDFSIPKLGSGQHNVFKSAGAWSEVNNQIQIGDAKVYNTIWTSGQIVDLDALKNSNIYQTINLDAGYYQLNITWAANILTRNLDSSKFSVYWNDVLVQFFTPVDYNIHKQTLTVKAIQGANKLSLRGEGTMTSGDVGAGINFVGLYAQKNKILNGGFQNPDQRGGWSIVKTAGQWTSNINQIEIGAGTIYNSVWKTGQITELDVNSNVQISQIVSIPAGNYNIRFDWASRTGIPLSSSAFSVWWNGAKLTLTTATDYLLHTFTANVEAIRLGNNTLAIRGEGTSDGAGIGVDNVRLWTA